ncbi:MAG: hypothetical protein UY33_C0037G0007 [Candidatus Amesbacteria bacterium GW2011_GWA1_48_9]|uniref:Uncharacterized protein n=1 Tax=Candidatus Amesbacteria bacterium GW2011_GWA1_48_9 TaxID=1618355 RepID=A0A0G1UYD5_9BACT|nr:MAG: hypothetical protein UY33_C0037G0007 [Candidatus Amesbacteria bacterium GW2011_GWA1_48_9]
MDRFGPEHVVKVYDPETGMRGFLYLLICSGT